MSKAFTKEDDEIPDRVSRKRSSSGLPPGAINYMTEQGAQRLRSELAELQKRTRSGSDQSGESTGGERMERVAKLTEALASATVVPTREVPPGEILFGTAFTVRAADGALSCHRIVGVDEADLELGWVSWQSTFAKALLGAEVGQKVQLPDASKAEIVEIGL